MQNCLSPLDTDPERSDDVLISIEIDLDTEVIAVALHGELDVSTGRRLLSALEPFASNGRPRVRMDLDHIQFMDSSGAMAIVTLSDQVALRDGFLEVAGCSPHVEKTFTLLGIPVPGVLRD